MENFIVSARKYRPQVFDEVVGQQHVTNTLFNAIQNDHLAQALLFTGPRGVGKTTSARILAKMINADDQDPEDQDYSYNVFELDAASNNTVDDIRSLIDQVRFAPQKGRYKVYIIDEVHMLSQAAFNAFLKTLEEPPKHAIFILATTEKHKIIPTILSRCQIYDFKRISVEDILKHLQNVASQEGVEAEERALRIIAQKADGALRDALSIFDRIVSFSGQKLSYEDVIDNLRILDYDYYFRTTELIAQNDQAGLFRIFNEVLENGFDGHLFINGLAAHFRDLLVCQDPSTHDLFEQGEEIKARYIAQAKEASATFLLRGLKVLTEADYRYKGSQNTRLLVELALMELGALWGKSNSAASGEKKKPELEREAARPADAKQPEPSPQAKSNSPDPETNIPPKTAALAQEEEPTKEATRPSELSKSELSKSKAAPEPSQKDLPKSNGNLSSNQSEGQADKKEEAVKGLNKLKKKAGGLSINATLKGQRKTEENKEEEEDFDSVQSGKPTEDFGIERLKKVWQEYVDQARANNMPVVVATLENKPLELLESHEAELTLDNKIQEDCFHSVKGELIPFCREKLNNFAFKVKVKIEKNSQKLRPYSAPEKYQYLLSKNHHLEELRKSLDLDIE